MTKDEQARARLVEIALEVARKPDPMVQALADPFTLRQRAGMKDPKRGHWCAAGLTAAMDIAGLVVPAPGTPARRGAVALLDFVWAGDSGLSHDRMARWSSGDLAPGDVIAWLQNKAPAEWLLGDGQRHAFATMTAPRSMCGRAVRSDCFPYATLGRCSSCVWETRKGHVALIVAVDDESLTTVGWNEGAAPGRVMKRGLWRDPQRLCDTCKGRGILPNTTGGMGHTLYADCPECKHPRGLVPRSSTVLHRKPNGLLYGIARPVAR